MADPSPEQLKRNRQFLLRGFELIGPFLDLWFGAICSAIALMIATDTVRP